MWKHAAAALSVLALVGGAILAEDAKSGKTTASFGSLQSPAPEAAKTQALNWLKSTGKASTEIVEAFDKVWSTELPLLDKVASTLTLGDADAAKLLAAAKDPKASAPTELPAVIRETKGKPAYFRANLALAYGKALTTRRVYEEALDSFRTIKPEDVVDPAGYYFHRAITEHALMLRNDADQSILRLLDDVIDSPERYKMVGALMHFEMLGWRDKDLGWISRKMDNIGRRLDLDRGGPQTQKMQKEVVMRLDEMIKEMENKQKGGGNCNGGNCPNGGDAPDSTIRPSSPKNDSTPGSGAGPGQIDPKRVKDLVESWGKLPEKDRAKFLMELRQSLPPNYVEAIESYLKKIDTEAKNGK